MLNRKEEFNFFKTEKVLRYFKFNERAAIYLTNSRIIFEDEEDTSVFPLGCLIRITKKYDKYKFYFPYFRTKRIKMDPTLPEDFLVKTREVLDYIMRYKMHMYLFETPSDKQEISYFNELRLFLIESKPQFEKELKIMNLSDDLNSVIMDSFVKTFRLIFFQITTQDIEYKINSFPKKELIMDKKKITTLSYKMPGKGLLLRRGITELKGESRDFENTIEKSLVENLFPLETIVKRTMVILTKQKENMNDYKYNLANLYNVIGFSIKYLILNTRKYNEYNDKYRKVLIINDLSFEIVYIKKIIINACKSIDAGEVVVIEDTSKFEITHIFCTLIKMLCHSYYRTIEGFLFLIKREWLNYGFDFNKDFEFVNEIADNNQSIFILMLFTVYSMICFSPKCFEFKENLIVFLIYHCSSGYYFPFAPLCYYGQEFQKNENIFNVITENAISFNNTTFDPKIKLREILNYDEINYKKQNKDSTYEEMDQSRTRRCLKDVISNLYEYYNKNVLESELQYERKSWKFYQE